MRNRLIIIFVVFLSLWGILLARAAFLQFLPNDRLTQLQNRQFQTVINLEARRGAILDRQGRELALSTTTYSLYADPKLIDNKKWLAKRLAKELGETPESIYQKLRDSSKRFVWIERWMSQDTMQRIKNYKIRGLAFVEEWRRVYPNDTLLSQTLGFMGNEGNGLEGVELAYDSDLRGNHKKVVVRRDARGRPLMADGLLFTENPDGDDITLTIDSELQYALENELANAVKDFEAHSAYGIILDAKTSAIRAIASVPTFNLNNALKISPDIRRNHPLTDAYEPGSTMKTFLIATALHDKALQPNTKFYCEQGEMKIGKRTIHEAEAKEKFGWLTASEILAFSSNIGSAKIAFSLGDDKLRQGLESFGFGQKLGIELPGEARGQVQALPWHQHLLANIAFGQGIAATPLQVANAYAAIANGGHLQRPYIVDSIRKESGEIVKTEPELIRDVLTPEESEKMRIMLTGVTSDGGTGVNARVNGFLVGGKTGTAQKVSEIPGKGYVKGAYISSFAGFIPASSPEFVIYVAVDQPKKAFYGAQVAAPIFSRVASYAVRREGIAPAVLGENGESTTVKNRRPASAPIKATALAAKLKKAAASKVDAIKPVIETNQFASEKTEVKTSVELIQEVDAKKFVVMPELREMTLREVLKKFNGQDVQLRVVGQGQVSETVPAAGEAIPENKSVTVILK